MTVDFVELLRQASGYANQVVHVEPLPPRAARYAEPAVPLPEPLRVALNRRGITRFYSHQAAALDQARAGAHLGIITATASGKTLCYQLPALEALLGEPQARVLCLFPTKALAGDQLRSFNRLLEALPHMPQQLVAATLDGDTPRAERDRLRTQAQIMLSNPDMLHRTLLPDHRRWAGLLARLRFVVLDEAHVYRGVFGTHVALIMRRLRRLCAYYGADPQFICCSATSANPQEHLQALIGDPVTLIDDDGAPRGPKSFVLWNPPPLEPKTKNREPYADGGMTTIQFLMLGPDGQIRRDDRALWNPQVVSATPASASTAGRRSTNVETANLLAVLVRGGVKTLAFTRTRRGAELVLRYVREAMQRSRESGGKNALPFNAAQDAPIAAYRAGYTPAERRRLEQAFLHGELLGLVSTNALELGVDIGGVDAVVIGGFPGTVASAWQQAGRGGRAQAKSLAVLVAQDDPLDQFYMRHPEKFFAQSVEHARVALDNPYILSDQLRCAAFELALEDADAALFGPTFPAMRDWLLRHGELLPTADGRAVLAARWPAARVNIRSADGAPIELRDSESGRVIEQLSTVRAPFEVYPGAIYLHQGDSYLVAALHETHADARRTQVSYYTQPREETNVVIERVREQRRLGPVELFLGVVEVTRQVTGYRRKEHYTEALLSEHDLTLPPQSFRTIAVWWTIPYELCRKVEQHCAEEVDALHAMEHAAIGMLPLFAQCDRADIGGLSINRHPDTGMATIFVYDGVPGGVGIAQVGYEQAEEWWNQTYTLLRECPCEEGCPACIQSPKCGNGNQHLSKPGAIALTALLLGHSTF